MKRYSFFMSVIWLCGLITNLFGDCVTDPPSLESLTQIFGEFGDCPKPDLSLRDNPYFRYLPKPEDYGFAPAESICIRSGLIILRKEKKAVRNLFVITDSALNDVLRKLLPETSFRQLWEARKFSDGAATIKTKKFEYFQDSDIITLEKEFMWSEKYADSCIELKTGIPYQEGRNGMTSVAILKWK